MIVNLKELRKELTDDISHKKVFLIGTYGVLCLVSLVMTVMNLYTEKGPLTMATAVFSLLCAVNIVLSLINEKLSLVAKALFAGEVVLMFTFFLVSGNPEGFSAIWICMLPSLGMFFFDRVRGSVLCAVMFAVLVFFLWVPFGNTFLMYEYTDAFKMRFPVLFLAFHALAFFLETLRVYAYQEMRAMQTYYQDLSVRDPLTQILNRQGMYSELETRVEFKAPTKVGAAIFDIDFFKQVNDTYGHNVGDLVLKDFAEIIRSNLNAVVCRWGGEEFVAVFADGNVTKAGLERVRKLIEKHPFGTKEQPLKMTVSIGLCETKQWNVKEIDQLIERADEALYEAKKNGRNQTTEYYPPKIKK